MAATLICDRCKETVSLKAYLPEKVITFFPTTWWMLENEWYSNHSVDICPRCFEAYFREIQNTERRFMQIQKPDLRDAEHI